jgi:GDP-4-dehydro-6-deoxy-D-mannose reductase
MRVLITGAGGFIGWYLVCAYAGRGDVVQAWVRDTSRQDWREDVKSVAVNITDRDAVAKHLGDFEPDLIIHLAAQSLPARSWDYPALTYEVNVVGTIHVLESVRIMSKLPRLLIAGSSAEYADPGNGQLITETTPTVANSPYGASKIATSQLGELYGRRFGLDVVRFRPFFIAGARKTGDVCSDFARRVVAIERGESNELPVGSLDVVRDIMDIRDGVAAILRIADVGVRGEIYNVATGYGVRVGNILDIYRSLARVAINVTTDPSLLRPMEQKFRVGDARKLRELGWEPKHQLKETLQWILDYWRTSGLGSASIQAW